MIKINAINFFLAIAVVIGESFTANLKLIAFIYD